MTSKACATARTFLTQCARLLRNSTKRRWIPAPSNNSVDDTIVVRRKFGTKPSALVSVLSPKERVMFSQRLVSSTESRWQKVGSMMMSFTVHVAFAAILLISPVLVTQILADHRPGSLVASLNFSPQPGDPSQQESQPNTLQVPHQQIVTLRPDTASKIKQEPEDSVEPGNNLLVISSLVAEKPTVAPGFYGSCGCIRPIMPRPETQQETQGKQPIK